MRPELPRSCHVRALRRAWPRGMTASRLATSTSSVCGAEIRSCISTRPGIPGLLVLTPARFGDARGFFSETWNRERPGRERGIDIDFVQDNHSLSAAVGTVRGLHFQAPPHAQAQAGALRARGSCSTWRWNIPQGLAHLWTLVRRRAEFRERQAASDPGGFRPWFRDAGAGHRDHLQMLRLLRRRRPRARCATTTPTSASTGVLAIRLRSCRTRTQLPGPSRASTAPFVHEEAAP